MNRRAAARASGEMLAESSTTNTTPSASPCHSQRTPASARTMHPSSSGAHEQARAALGGRHVRQRTAQDQEQQRRR